MTERAGIICAGNWIVDLVHDIEHWPEESNLVRIGLQTRGIGGGAANVIAALAKLDTGLPLWPMGAIGDDEHGSFVLNECRALGLPTDQLKIKPGVATAHTHVMSVAGRSRTFFYQGGANDELGAVDFPAGTFTQTPARIFYLGYLTLLGELDRIDADGVTGTARVLERAVAAGLTTCIDLVSTHHAAFQEIVVSAAPYVDYLIANEIEAARATGTEIDPKSITQADALSRMARALITAGARKAVIIHCEDRVVWCGADGVEHVVDIQPLEPQKIASHLGAGDAFCAGLLHAVHEGWAPARAIELANATARSSLQGLTATSAIPPLSSLDLGACPNR